MALSDTVLPKGLLPLALLVIGAPVLFLLYYLVQFVYNIYFHPLSKYPGPRIPAGTSWWAAASYIRGTTPNDLLQLHNRYGPVVRTSPNELSYIQPAQWKEIYGHKASGQPEFTKDKKYHSGLVGPPVLLNADREYHGYIRKLLAHGFSERALRDQEAVMQEYVATLFRKLHEACQDGRPVEISAWYNFMTFDFIGFLSFGESFDCLTSSRIHKWIEIFFSLAKLMAFNQAISRLPRLIQLPAKLWAIPPSVKSDVATLNQLNTEKTSHRIKYESTVPDFMDKLIDAYKDGKMSFEQLTGNASILIGAGSETTATALSGLTYLLLKNPRVYTKLTREIRNAFASSDEITFVGVNQCKYLLACIEEVLRVYPPSPQPHQRIVPAGGALVNGEFLPAGTAVSIPIYAACMSPANWAEPESFLPERWLGGEDPRFANDKRDAFQPFSYGPRNCIGRNLAYVEMKIIVARLLWHFDLQSATDEDWLDQKVYMVWEKSPLWIKLVPVKSGRIVLIIQESTQSLIHKRKMDQFYLENVSQYQTLLKGLKPPSAPGTVTAETSNSKMIVSARIRPMLDEDFASRFPCAIFSRSMQNNVLDLHDLYNHPSGRPQLRSSSYQMDKVFGSDTKTETIFNSLVANLISFAWQGGTGSLFAYGQTGSGKTFTISRLQALVIDTLLSKNVDGTKQIYMTMVELAGNSAFDLLSARKSVMILEDAAGETQIFGAREQRIEDKSQVTALLRSATKLRRAASTSKNDGSSRSHSICRVRIEDPSSDSSSRPAGFLYLVDLAGSEVARDIASHSADRMKETREINKSLSTLKDCIRGRAEWDAAAAAAAAAAAGGNRSSRPNKKRPHIPFRHCALTKVLKHIFDPNDNRDTRTVVIACVNPNLADAKSSKNTLRYAEMLRVFVPVDEESKDAKAAGERVLTSRDPDPAAESIPFTERIRPGMVIQWKHSDSTSGDGVGSNPSRNFAVVLCPSDVVDRNNGGSNECPRDNAETSMPGLDDNETAQNGREEKWQCALLMPGFEPRSYELCLWQQVSIDISMMVNEVILRYDQATRYYYMGELNGQTCS
ncbi:hypothetical protein PFICI_10168 [Pestalotiopsis fici W106-1]|uniref:Kinesin motor domain-containing protein n=1 Tax=Pestalotiopsis fici (strain W106-1 / CGMCC3.15140) TaxID=1229662 RepID=W3WYY7_PESFW|nr:uncharacterized protein PFICI_10168 [Pestalotiopsis fici W106-1]ETS78106.1 hypothetical protein PFICI_10168 [Pestalotiopsis fici W106-1]